MPVPDDVVAPSPVLAATVVDSKLRTPSLPAPTAADIVDRLTQIVSNYLLTTSPNDQFERGGRVVLSSQINWHVKQNVPIEL